MILGAGPTGLGAAQRLTELDHKNFVVYEKEATAGGLATSITDDAGFTWDIGGHVQFSHYKYFDDLMDSLMGDEWLIHERESWVWILDRFVPYPFQNNIRYLPKQARDECLRGLIQIGTQRNGRLPENFEEWIRASFGEGIAKYFMMPYNFKVWGYAPRDLSFQWIGERVATVDLERVVFNILEGRDDVSWGPNHTFRFPLRGGTGEIWNRLAKRFQTGQVNFGKRVVHVDSTVKEVRFQDGSKERYDILISTMPIDVLVQCSDLESMKNAAQTLRHSTTHVVGIGLRGEPPPTLQKKCWMYFPEDSSPFYRATVFSNYSPYNVPEGGKFWSLMVEVSESPSKPVDRGSVVESAISGLLATRLIDSKNDIVDTWHCTADYGYPTPTITRDSVLHLVQPTLEQRQIFSRGRFGGWKYEVSNQDHSLMQGVELVDRLVAGQQERTLWNPSLVNRSLAQRSLQRQPQ